MCIAGGASGVPDNRGLTHLGFRSPSHTKTLGLTRKSPELSLSEFATNSMSCEANLDHVHAYSYMVFPVASCMFANEKLPLTTGRGN